jgi:hypothetical protein
MNGDWLTHNQKMKIKIELIDNTPIILIKKSSHEWKTVNPNLAILLTELNDHFNL